MSHSTSPLPANSHRLLRVDAVLALTGLPKSTLYRMIAERRFPAPVRLSERARAWPEAEVQGWIADRLAMPRGTRAGTVSAHGGVE